MNFSSPVDALLKRLNLEKYVEAFREQNIINAKSLKNLSPEDMADLVPHVEDRKKLTDAIASGNVPHAPPQGQASGGDGLPSGPTETSRPIFDTFGGGPHQFDRFENRPRKGGKKGKGKGKGSKGHYHDDDMMGSKGYKGNPRAPVLDDADFLAEKPNVVEVEVKVPTNTIPFLLASKAQKLQTIHSKYSTHNSKIEKTSNATTVFKVFGPPENVEKAKEEIESLAGVGKRMQSDRRFQDSLLGRTKLVTSLLYALNERRLARDDPTALPSETIPEHVSHYLFCNPYSHIQQFYIKVNEKPRTKIDLLGMILFKIPTCQTLVFCKNGEHIKDLLMKRVKQEQLAGIDPSSSWMFPTMDKDERQKVMARFEQGFGPVDKVEYKKLKRDEQKEKEEAEYQEHERTPGGFQTDKNRLLITTDDYARFARKKPIPYVSLVFSYDIPKTKEGYLFRIGCCGRGGNRGVAITLVGPNEQDWVSEMTQVGVQLTELPANFREAIDVDTTTELLEPETPSELKPDEL